MAAWARLGKVVDLPRLAYTRPAGPVWQGLVARVFHRLQTGANCRGHRPPLSLTWLRRSVEWRASGRGEMKP